MKASLIALLGAVALAGCGGSNPSVAITLTTSGVTAVNSTVRYGYDLVYTNKDTVPHAIGSLGCPKLAVGTLQPNASATANVGDVTYVGKSCDLFDPQNPSYGSLTIRVLGAG